MVFSNTNNRIFDKFRQWSPSSHAHSDLPSSNETESAECKCCCPNYVEEWWREQQQWLEGCGYMLRPRYMPGWIPSWIGTHYPPELCEDSLALPDSWTLDATRISDGIFVVLKVINEKWHPDEADTALFLSSNRLSLDLRNHSVPVCEVLEVPHQDNLSIIVMPLLRPCDDPNMKTIGEAAELLRQIFEGLDFMHENLVAHLNPDLCNITYGPSQMYPDMYHPLATDMSYDLTQKAKHYTRTEYPPKYYFMDFCISRRFQTNPALHDVVRWKKNFAPEYKRPEHQCDPFSLDVYLLGDMIREQFLMKYRGLAWIQPLVNDMCQEDPLARPTMAEALTRYEVDDCIFKLPQTRCKTWYEG